MALMRHSYGKVLYTESPRSTLRTAIYRFLFLVGIIAVTALIFYFEREGLSDSANPDKHVDIIGIIYFTIVTITTLGYGDIVPVTPGARLFDAIFVTGVRIITYLIIITTALELTLPKLMEGFMLSKLKKRTKNHTIICGFGRVGREILDQIIKKGEDTNQIVVIDTAEEKTNWAAEKGVAALRGDAENEEILEMADIYNARRMYLCANQDHTNLMICLTARNMNENLEIIAMAREKENVKLFKNSGASRVVSLPELLSLEMTSDKQNKSET